MMTLTFLDGLFFAIVTTLTIGFGDIVPKTAAQRIVVCFYAAFGIVILGAAVRLTSEAILEGLEVGYRRRLREYRKRRHERKHERQQVRRWRVAVEERLVERGIDVWTPDKPAPGLSPLSPLDTRPTLHRRGTFGIQQAMYLNTEALPPDVLESAAQEAGVPAEKFIGRKFGRRARQQQSHHHHHHGPQQQQGTEAERRGRVPLDFTWTIEDDGMHGAEQCKSWGSSLWERTREVLRLANAGGGVPSAQQGSGGELTYQDMVKVLKKDERRSLYIKVRHLFLCNNSEANKSILLDWTGVDPVPHLLDRE
jgi:Ion channel